MGEVTAEMIERGRGANPEASARRRQFASQMRIVRERLTSAGSGHRIFDLELLRFYAQSHLSASPAMMLLAFGISCLSTVWMSALDAIIWMSLLTTGFALTRRSVTRFLALSESEIDPKIWRRKFVLAEVIQGLLWSFLVVLLLNQADPAARTFVLFVFLLVTAMTAMVAASLPSAVYGGLIPLTGAIVIFLLPTEGLESLPLTIMACGAQLYFIVLARRLHATSIDTLSLSMEKEALIAELEQAKLNSDEARRRSEEANLAKSRFLATMSHELRTPLNAILGFSEVMKSELFGAHSVPVYKEYAGDIHSSGQHLLMLINEILDLSRVEAGRYELKEEPVLLSHVVEDCRHLLSLRARNRGLVVNEAIEPALPRIWADERAVRQVTLNLLSNAIKFTPQGGTININVGWTAAGGQYLSIRDTGPGIPPEEIPIIMSSFGRGSLAQKNADEGSGLGLPIVKGLIELHGGRFSIKSELRVGTEVIVVFPPERVIDALPQLKVQETVRPERRRSVRSAA